jgi:hypothetical protein
MTDPITPETLAQLEALAASATPGPWHESEDEVHPAWRIVYAGGFNDLDVAHIPPWMTHVEANAAYIVAACNAYPALSAALREAWARIAELEDQPARTMLEDRLKE